MAGRGLGAAGGPSSGGGKRAAGHVPRPMYEPINTSAPSKTDLELDAKLEAFMRDNVPVMTSVDLRRREQVLGKIRAMFLQWVIDSALEAGMSEEAAKAAGGKIYTSGSYRLRIHEPNSDIDAICVAPQFCTSELFFTTLKERLIAHPLVANVNAIQTAAVPIIELVFDEIDIDLGLACLPVPTVPPTLDIDDDQVLDGVDRPTEKCVNGPRVTNMIHRLVPNYDSFLPVVRCVRKWAKSRGLYSNKMGYLGGVNFNIMVAFACQMYPNAGPSTLLHRFFKLMAGWNWPNAIQLVQPYDAELGLEVWNARANSWHCMPIITPAYPVMNSSANVSRFTLDVMTSEFSRGLEVVNGIMKEKGSLSAFSKLFEPSDFFLRYNHYLAVDMMASSEEEHRAWVGWVESRLRKLVEGLGLSGLPFKRVHLWPKKFEGCVGGGVGGELPAHSVAYFIGLEIDPRRSKKGAVLDVDKVTNRFRMESVGHATSRGFHRPGMDVMATAKSWKDLPGFVFESIGGSEAAAAERKRRRRAEKERLAAIAAAAPKPEQLRAAKEAAAAAAAAAAATAAAATAAPADSGGVQEAPKTGGPAVKKEDAAPPPVLPPTPAEAAAVSVKPEAALEGDLDDEGATKLVLSGARAALPGQKRKRAVDVVDLVDLVPVVPSWKNRPGLPPPPPPSSGGGGMKRLTVQLLPHAGGAS
ncbi:unnamed protein product [Ectocarpus sp. CCAP 1310/34]|nr:unnamed protein product [Ectocarpus sp. CCAP 1310/34]